MSNETSLSERLLEGLSKQPRGAQSPGQARIVLQRLREEMGWSKSELARRAVMNSSDVSKIERGMLTPYPGQLAKLAKAFGLAEDQANKLMEEDRHF